MPATTDSSPLIVSTLTPYGHGFPQPAMNLLFSSAGNVAWPAANLAIYMPLTLPFSYSVQRIFYHSGGTNSGNIDLGIYDASFNQLAHTGNFATSGGSGARVYRALVVSLSAGTYYLGISIDNGTQTLRMSTPTADSARLLGVLQQAGANPLPSPATPAAMASAVWPFIGITRTSSGF